MDEMSYYDGGIKFHHYSRLFPTSSPRPPYLDGEIWRIGGFMHAQTQNSSRGGATLEGPAKEHLTPVAKPSELATSITTE